MPIKQRTLKNKIKALGVGLHKGEKVLLTLKPAPANTGIIFKRVDLGDNAIVPAKVEYVCDTRLGTSLNCDGVGVATVEHLMSAFSGMGIDNAIVEVDAPEIPIMDGSASPFVFLLQSAGIQEQQALKKFLKVKQKVEVEEDDKYVKIEPYNGFKASLSLDYSHPVLINSGQQTELNLNSSISYIKEISRARTFGFMSDYEWLKANNLALGGSLDNALVIDETSIMNQGGLRYTNEFVKHKILDAIGDLYLSGMSILGAFTGYKSGHAMNYHLLKTLLSKPDSWEVVTLDELNAPIVYAEAYSSSLVA